MNKKYTLILCAAIVGSMTLFASIPQFKITVGEKTITLYPGEKMIFGASGDVSEGVDHVIVNINKMDLGSSTQVEYRHSDAAPRVNGVELLRVGENSFSSNVSLNKGEKVYFDGIGRAGILLNKNLRNYFTLSDDGEYAVFKGYTDIYNVTLDLENLVGTLCYSHPDSEISIDGMAIDYPFTGGYDAQYDGKEIQLVKGQKVNFEGVPDLKKALQLHFWDVISDTEATFKGNDGSYDLIWDKLTGLFFTELHGWREYPEMLYIGGSNWGHSGADGVTVPAWQNNQMKGMMNLNNSGDNKWECSMYLAQGFAFKFAGAHYMNGTNEYSGKDIEPLNPELIGVDATWGDFIPGSNFTPGVYWITVDLDKMTLTAEKMDIPVKDMPVYIIGGKEMAVEGTVCHASIELTEGQTVSFENLPNLAKALQPDFWEVTDFNSAIFKGMGGTYDIYYDPALGIAFTMSGGMNFDEGKAVWVAGIKWGHPSSAPSVTATGWDLTGAYNNCMQMKKVEEGVYEATLYLPSDFNIKFFKARTWESEASTKILTPEPGSMFAAGTYNSEPTGDLVAGPDFVPGVYTVRVDYNRNIVYAEGYYTPVQ
jgi:hypothetical protein